MGMQIKPYSYRSDTRVPKFMDDCPVLFFDGVCVLCAGFARFVLNHDLKKRVRLCAAHSPLGQAIYEHYGLNGTDFETNLLIADGKPYVKSDAFIETMCRIGGIWTLLTLLRVAPRGFRNWVYDPIALNRYRWFGQNQSCFIPQVEDQDRFLS